MPITTTFQDPMSGTMTEASNRFPGGVPPDIIQATPAVTVPYAFSQDSADTVSKIVSDCAGTGKINLSP
jgi:hypothetical protein